MIPIDLSGKVALVTGVGDNQSFAWFISKTLKAAGAKIVLAVPSARRRHRRGPLRSRRPTTWTPARCPTASDFQPAKVFAVRRQLRHHGRRADGSEERPPLRQVRRVLDPGHDRRGRQGVRRHRHPDPLDRVRPRGDQAAHRHQPQGLPRSDGDLIVLARQHGARRGAAHGQPAGRRRAWSASPTSAGEKVVPHYGGGMGTCKSALQMDAKQLAWFVGDKNVRVNLISAGPYASRAAKAINKDFDKLIDPRRRALAAAPADRPRGSRQQRRSTCAARWRAR